MLAAAFVLCFTMAACGSEEAEKTEEPTVEATPAAADTSVAPAMDTTAMDTATTRPVVKPGNAPAQQ